GNDEGIPPDNFLRTAVGVYPAGGRFDGNSDVFPFRAHFDANGDYIGYRASIAIDFDQNVGLGFGGGGAGIEPFVLASYVKFWRAEANLMLGNTGAASSNLEAGMATSIAKVMTFGSLDGGGDFSYAPDTADEDIQDLVVSPSEFVERMTDAFDDAPVSSGLDGNGFPVERDKMDILGEQFFVAMYGGAGDAWNFIRRTGYPRTIGRNTEDIGGSGLFPRTLLYPGNEIGANPNIQQRLDLSTKVFWDSGVTNPAN
ncbi:MAG: SusD/RagB family nutrient-binding outer membrane lipoprotein, partial [Bacteroidetes bacterium]|nr:SusD/RagB family nutrient-binding outer membrane lipoprotein [Bacteroidota bacterium]